MNTKFPSADVIRTKLAKFGYTQASFAKEIGIRASSLSSLINNRRQAFSSATRASIESKVLQGLRAIELKAKNPAVVTEVTETPIVEAPARNVEDEIKSLRMQVDELLQAHQEALARIATLEEHCAKVVQTPPSTLSKLKAFWSK